MASATETSARPDDAGGRGNHLVQPARSPDTEIDDAGAAADQRGAVGAVALDAAATRSRRRSPPSSAAGAAHDRRDPAAVEGELEQVARRHDQGEDADGEQARAGRSTVRYGETGCRGARVTGGTGGGAAGERRRGNAVPQWRAALAIGPTPESARSAARASAPRRRHALLQPGPAVLHRSCAPPAVRADRQSLTDARCSPPR